MTFSKNFMSRYQGNEEMEEIISRVDQHLEGSKIQGADKELVYEFVYGQKLAMNDKYEFGMEKLYHQLEFLDEIKHEPVFSDGVPVGGIFEPHGSTNPSRPACIIINDILANNASDPQYTIKEAAMHELEHLASERFEPSYKTNPFTSMVGEIGVQNATNNLMRELDYETETYLLQLKTKGVDAAYVEAPSQSYAAVVGAYEYLQAIYGEREIIAAQFNDETLPTTHKDGKSVSLLLSSSYEQLKWEINDAIKHTELNPTFENYAKMQGLLIYVFEQNMDNPNLNCSIEKYMELMQKISPTAMCFEVNEQEFNSVFAQTTTFDVQNIYSQIHDLSGTELQKELNPMTRSQDCKDFLIAINGLKSIDMELSKEDILGMKYYQAMVDDMPVIRVEVGGKTIDIDGQIDAKTGFITIESAEYSTEKAVAFQHSEWGNASYEYLALSHLMNHKSYNTITINVFKLSQQDDYGNNAMHIIANSPTDNFLKLIPALAEKRPEDLTRLLVTPNKEGLTPVDMAIINNNVAFFEAISDADIKLNVNYENIHGASPLLYSTMPFVSERITMHLLEDHDANPDLISSRGKLALTELLVKYPQSEKIEILLDFNADISRESIIRGTDTLYTPFEVASGMYNGKVNMAVVTECLSRGADMCQEGNSGESPYGYAVRTENVDFFIAAAQAGFNRDRLGLDDIALSKESIDKIEAAIEEYAASHEEAFAFE